MVLFAHIYLVYIIYIYYLYCVIVLIGNYNLYYSKYDLMFYIRFESTIVDFKNTHILFFSRLLHFK